MRKLFVLTILSTLCSLASAQAGAQQGGGADAVLPAGSKVRAVMPVFSQLLAFSYPKGFAPAFEEARNGNYIQESVLKGESVQSWSQMLTVTGAKGLASNPDQTPISFANEIAAGFRSACPDSFAGRSLGEFKLDGHDAFAAVASCGNVGAADGARSESALLVVIKGKRDYYTFQWAERGKAARGALPFDGAKWSGRLRQLGPLALCPIVPGEAAPYPSCSLGLS